MSCAKKDYVDSDDLKSILLWFINSNKIKTKYVHLTLNSREIILKCTALNVPPKEVGQALKYDLKSYLLIEHDNYIVDYKITRAVENKTYILIAAVPKIPILQYISIFKEIDINLVKIDVFQNVIAKAFASESNALIISETDGRVHLTFSDKGVVTGTREIAFLSNDSIISEILKLFDSFLTNTVFESVFILNENLRFLTEYFDFQGIECRIPEDADFLALKASVTD